MNKLQLSDSQLVHTLSQIVQNKSVLVKIQLWGLFYKTFLSVADPLTLVRAGPGAPTDVVAVPSYIRLWCVGDKHPSLFGNGVNGNKKVLALWPCKMKLGTIFNPSLITKHKFYKDIYICNLRLALSYGQQWQHNGRTLASSSLVKGLSLASTAGTKVYHFKLFIDVYVSTTCLLALPEQF